MKHVTFPFVDWAKYGLNPQKAGPLHIVFTESDPPAQPPVPENGSPFVTLACRTCGQVKVNDKCACDEPKPIKWREFL